MEEGRVVDVAALARAWAIGGSWRLAPLVEGTNNLVFRVDERYVLHLYANHAEAGRLRFEHDVVARLEEAGLPFALPTPIPTTNGATFARIATDAGEALAVLTAFIPGAPADRADPARVVAAGEAVGLLDAALARVALPEDAAATSWRSYGDLEHCHPLVPDPPAALGALAIVPDSRRALLARYAWLMERIPAIYGTLPRQICHEDMAPSNLLMAGERVTGVLDFEFCARDVRVMDLTVALSWWPGERFGGGDEWPIIAAFAAGYARHIALTDDEIAAIPVLFELRAFTSLIHRLGRHRQGLSPLDAVTARASAALARHDWLRAHGARLVETVGAAMAAQGERRAE